MSMRRLLANWLNELGRRADNENRASRLYHLAAQIAPDWSTPWYNLGLKAKYSGRWEESLRYNKRATELDGDKEAAWWNLGIAATALHDWTEARRAWKGFGIDLPDEAGEVSIPPVSACVRLNPKQAGEVVWGDRLDPARFLILNIPLPESEHRFRDVILNDGAPEGTRIRNGVEFPVFDELEIWQPSEYSTFEAQLEFPGDASEERLAEICHKAELGIEDWSTLRILCEKCSRGNPGPHDCHRITPTGVRRAYAFAAKREDDLKNALHEWTAVTEGAAFGDLRLVL
jgi:tetratricopeptide (TPR) repeat protein